MQLPDSIGPLDDSILDHPLVKYMESKLLIQQAQIAELESLNARLESNHGQLLARVETLEAEVKRMKKLPKRPKILASSLDKADGEGKEDKNKGTGGNGLGQRKGGGIWR